MAIQVAASEAIEIVLGTFGDLTGTVLATIPAGEWEDQELLEVSLTRAPGHPVVTWREGTID